MSIKHIDTYLQGKASESQTRALNEWLEQEERNRIEFLATKLRWKKASSDDHGPGSKYGFEQIKARYHRVQRNRKRRVAAVVALVLCVGALFPFWGSNSKSATSVNLEFQNAALAVVIDRIEEAYKIEIEVQNQTTLLCEFTGVFYNASPENLVRAVAKSKGLNASRVNDSKFVLGGRCM